MNPEVKNKIDNLIKENTVVLFMKGTASQPACGFSAKVVSILRALDVNFKDVDILEDVELREGIKKYSEWPTIPQLYINGEFIGGCDVAIELMKSGELSEILSKCENRDNVDDSHVANMENEQRISTN